MRGKRQVTPSSSSLPFAWQAYFEHDSTKQGQGGGAWVTAGSGFWARLKTKGGQGGK